MATFKDLVPLDEFDPRTAQVLLGDNPYFRELQAEMVALIKARIQESGDASMIALLPNLEEAHEAYRQDPQWCGGAVHVRLIEAARPLLRFLGVIEE